jgi:hypothetical protein
MRTGSFRMPSASLAPHRSRRSLTSSPHPSNRLTTCSSPGLPQRPVILDIASRGGPEVVRKIGCATSDLGRPLFYDFSSARGHTSPSAFQNSSAPSANGAHASPYLERIVTCIGHCSDIDCRATSRFQAWLNKWLIWCVYLARPKRFELLTPRFVVWYFSAAVFRSCHAQQRTMTPRWSCRRGAGAFT